MNYIQRLGSKAREAQAELAAAGSPLKNDALLEIAHTLRRSKDEITEANARDVKAARARNADESVIELLTLTAPRIEKMAEFCEKLCSMPDPVGEIAGGEQRPDGVSIQKVRVPIGVVGVICETSPDAAADSAAMCLKSGNAVMIRSGREAFGTNQCLVGLMRRAVRIAGLPEDIIQLVEDNDRGVALEMMQANGFIDLLIPRGSARFVNAVVRTATVPVIDTGSGKCHVYVDATADTELAAAITESGKTKRPNGCGAIESCLVHRYAADDFLPRLKDRLDKHGVRLRGCELTRMILGEENIRPVTENDFEEQFHDNTLAVRVVDGLGEAIEHIQRYGTGHSECIVTESCFSAEEFKRRIDAAVIYVNCPLSFTDGAQLGVSIQKLHARGPMGMNDLTTLKWVISSTGQTSDI